MNIFLIIFFSVFCRHVATQAFIPGFFSVSAGTYTNPTVVCISFHHVQQYQRPVAAKTTTSSRTEIYNLAGCRPSNLSLLSGGLFVALPPSHTDHSTIFSYLILLLLLVFLCSLIPINYNDVRSWVRSQENDTTAAAAWARCEWSFIPYDEVNLRSVSSLYVLCSSIITPLPLYILLKYGFVARINDQ